MTPVGFCVDDWFGEGVGRGTIVTDAGGEVSVSVGQVDKRAEVIVRDTGVGISAEDLPRIFERFYRADRSRNRQAGGAGLGLAIVKQTIEEHGGTVTCSSTPGVGTEFVVRLPLAHRG